MASVRADQAIPTGQSSAENWIAWYQILPGAQSVKNFVWLSAWDRRHSDAANTVALRSWMMSNAGISITADGIGSILSAGNSFVEAIESATTMSFYAVLFVGGCVLATAMYMVVKGLQNPEGTAKLIDSASGAALKIAV